MTAMKVVKVKVMVMVMVLVVRLALAPCVAALPCLPGAGRGVGGVGTAAPNNFCPVLPAG